MEEESRGCALGEVLWPFVMTIPITIAVVLYGVLPLGNPNNFFQPSGQWPMVFFIIPTAMTIISLLNVRIYSAAKNSKKRIGIAFDCLIAILAFTYVLEVFVLTFVVMLKGNIDLLGAVALGISYFVTFVGLYIAERFRWKPPEDIEMPCLPPANNPPTTPLTTISSTPPSTTTPTPPTTPTPTTTTTTIRRLSVITHTTRTTLFWAYLRMATLIFVHFVWLIVFIIAYREARWVTVVQPMLTIGLAIVLFIFKKALLSLTDRFPLETAMLIASLWLQSLNDIFQALAYPSVVNPIIYAYIWVIHCLANIANLIFLTNTWFRFRVWIKGVLSCRCNDMPIPLETDSNPDERGHSYNHPGYIRRQIRFFLWRIFSQIWAIMFYVSVSCILRYGPNRSYYPFSSDPHRLPDDSDQRNIFSLDWKGYGNSLIFVAVDSLAILLSGVIGWLYIRRSFPVQLRKVLWGSDSGDEAPENGGESKETQQAQPQQPQQPQQRTHKGDRMRGMGRYVELVVAILVYNGLVSVMILQYHLKIWWAFEGDADPPIDNKTM